MSEKGILIQIHVLKYFLLFMQYSDLYHPFLLEADSIYSPVLYGYQICSTLWFLDILVHFG